MPKNKNENTESENIKKQKLETTKTNDSQEPTTSKSFKMDYNKTNRFSGSQKIYKKMNKTRIINLKKNSIFGRK